MLLTEGMQLLTGDLNVGLPSGQNKVELLSVCSSHNALHLFEALVVGEECVHVFL